MCVAHLQKKLKDLGGHQTWLGPTHAAYHTHLLEYTTASQLGFSSKRKQLICWGAKWHLYSVGNQNLERDEMKSFVSNGVDLY